ncbi:MAG: hypothetical protein QXI58_01600 [Candidatus Micrarchaeia archaeon]
MDEVNFHKFERGELFSYYELSPGYIEKQGKVWLFKILWLYPPNGTYYFVFFNENDVEVPVNIDIIIYVWSSK